MARSGHGTDSWSAGQVASETAGLSGQSSGWHPQTAGIGALCRPESRLPCGDKEGEMENKHWVKEGRQQAGVGMGSLLAIQGARLYKEDAKFKGDLAPEPMCKLCATEASKVHHRWWRPTPHSHFLFYFLMNRFNQSGLPWTPPLGFTHTPEICNGGGHNGSQVTSLSGVH